MIAYFERFSRVSTSVNSKQLLQEVAFRNVSHEMLYARLTYFMPLVSLYTSYPLLIGYS